MNLNILRFYLKADKATTAWGVSALAMFLVLTSAALSILPTSAENTGTPIFNRFTSYVHTQTVGHDYYLLDVKNETKGISWNSSVSADPGDILAFYVYYHNGINNSVAQNTKIYVNLPSTTNTSQNITADLWADNATRVTGSSQVNISSAQNLVFIPSSLQWFPNQSSVPLLLPTGQSENLIFNASGLNIGDVQGCWEFSGAVVFKVKVSQITYAPTLTIDKKMRNITQNGSMSESLSNVVPQQTLGVQIAIANNGTAEAKNLLVKDILPQGSQLSYQWGSTKLDGVATYDIGSGYSISNLAPGQTKTLTFEVKTAQESQFTRGTTNLVNTATVKADNFSEIQDTVSVSIFYNGCTPDSNGTPASR